jgi:hypothetical protein
MNRPDPICPRCEMPHSSSEPCWSLDHAPQDEETEIDERIRKREEAGEKQYDSEKCD